MRRAPVFISTPTGGPWPLAAAYMAEAARRSNLAPILNDPGPMPVAPAIVEGTALALAYLVGTDIRGGLWVLLEAAATPLQDLVQRDFTRARRAPGGIRSGTVAEWQPLMRSVRLGVEWSAVVDQVARLQVAK